MKDVCCSDHCGKVADSLGERGEGEKNVKEWGWRAEELKVGGTEVKNREWEKAKESDGVRGRREKGGKEGEVRDEGKGVASEVIEYCQWFTGLYCGSTLLPSI